MNFVEARLAKLARNGDRNAFAELVELYKDKIFHLAYRMLNNKQEAEDAVQETFLRVYTNLHRYDENQKFSTWIFRIGTNLCIDKLRRRRNTYSLDAEMSDGEGADFYAMLPSDEDTPEEQLIVSETQAQIHRAIASLPEKYKSIVVLRYLHDMSLQEISDVLDMPVTTIKTRVHRGREYLRKKLEQEEEVVSTNPVPK
ncbi:RNA polymerase sigma factor SigW [Paenibacillus whitsoniae]|uniref:RNA polymerase sigma factor SigW n=1 Tax=Paenibacillus whitsoniae TaxID=2496558 RepID=A0A430JK44_9BACL|nr:RNA polymerase sigma factor SigW [Paenibacillus whitsoniae]RTE11437.1 RNA polymerase sigma factor SigW [Paenibacillus whitsoniae]